MKGLDIHFQLISKQLGFILGLEALFIFLSALVSVYFKEPVAEYLWISGGFTFVTGILLNWYGHGTNVKYITKKDSILTVLLSWLLFSIFGALPFYISGAIPSITDSIFETMSGLTTTGSSILTNVEALSKGLLFWRSLIQWIGGLGMIVFALAFLPVMAGGGSTYLFEDETSGISPDKFRPRIGQVAKRLWFIYLVFTVVLIILLNIGPMNTFDACCHAFAAMSTGGFSTKNASIAYWNSAYVEYVIGIFSLIGATNFTLWYFFFKGNFKRLFKDEELRWFLSIMLIATFIVTICLYYNKEYNSFSEAFRISFFHVTTIFNFYTADFTQWGPFFLVIVSFLVLIGGCGGSTSGGLKMIRFVILCKSTMNEFSKQIHPKAIIPVRLNGNAVSYNIVQRVLAFAFLYIATILVSIGVFTATGIKFEDAWGVALSGIGNIGPGFGEFGPAGSFASMTVFAKWYYSFLMMVGRLELFTVLILFTPGFWKK
ncbi:MAG: TrkH family potassium uptake protein [Candidatus Azobacteroides sp.]|nr:TrkH family potassium uptake protein [Candidatus Azobacteroides sp.]